jgi:hypothetical protein
MQPGHIYHPKPRAVTSKAYREVRLIVEEQRCRFDLMVHGASGGMCRAPADLIVTDTGQFEYDWFKPKQPGTSASHVEDAL